MSNHDLIRGYGRPAMLGGPPNGDSGALVVRWHGTSNYELDFHERVVLLDAFFDRGPRTRPLGFSAVEVTRADAILIGHPHYDHIGNAAEIAEKTGASVVVHPMGADVLVRDGLNAGQIIEALGRDGGESLEFPGFTVQVIHGLHADLTHSERQASLQALLDARMLWESDLGPLSPAEEAQQAEVKRRGISTPEVYTEATMCIVVDIDGFRIVFRDSAGPVSDEEREFFTRHPGCDLAIVGFAGRPLVRRQLAEATLPLIEAYQPRIVLPCHHDDLYPALTDMPTEPLKMAVRERFPDIKVLQPVYLEPIQIGLKNRVAIVGE
jgi:L-ascorbate metabolism protein UlaG (beta-lactamase superfamily)